MPNTVGQRKFSLTRDLHGDSFEHIGYDPETGRFHWKSWKDGRSIRPGREPGFITHLGYRRIQINGKDVLAHRLAWFLTYGKWPDCFIDHINGDRADNRIANLRDVDRAGNAQNRSRVSSGKRSCQYMGVGYNRACRKWNAIIRANGVAHYLGLHDTPEAAYAVYLEAKARLHLTGALPEHQGQAH